MLFNKQMIYCWGLLFIVSSALVFCQASLAASPVKNHIIYESQTIIQKKERPTLSAVVKNSSRFGLVVTKNTALSKDKTTDLAKNSDGYHLVKIRQKKGQSLPSAMKHASLTSVQQNLVKEVPVTKRARSTRYFYLLFEKQGNKKYLKAVRVVRGKNVAEFVLTRYRNKWVWADEVGRVSGGGEFLRYPLNYSRISSGFNLRRRHPITRRIRPHRGTDFAAPHGTRIWAPADGIVSFTGRQRGYGITLVINHGNGYQTKYAHLSRILVRKGARVKKRQIIARVGNTGASTGSHLHYEVIINGRHRNPMRVRLPGGNGRKTLPAAKLAAKKYLPLLRKMI